MNELYSTKYLAIVTYSSISADKEALFVNRALGMLADDLAQSFKKIYFVAAMAAQQSSVFNNGKSIYQYSIRSENVVITPTQPTGGLSNPVSRLYQMIVNQLNLNKVINESDFLYLFFPGYTGLLTAFVCLLKRKPYFLYFGSDWNETARFRLPDAVNANILNRLALKAYKFLETFVVKRAMFCLTAGKKLMEIYKVANPKTYETVPMVQFQKNMPISDKSNVFVPMVGGCNDRQKINILCVGNVRESKGTGYLLKALPLLRNKGFDVKVQIVGVIDETYCALLLKELNDHDMNVNVFFAGYVNDVEKLKAYYAAADVFVLPTLGEGFPRVLYEAMMSGVPVVASDIDSIRENTEGSEALTLVTPKNHEAIAAAVEELIRNDILRKRQIKAGYLFAERKFHTRPAAQVIQFLNEFGQ